MLNIGGPELLIIFLVALVVLGPTRLPQVARQVGQTVNSLRSLASGFQAEMEAASKAVTYDGPMHLPTEQANPGESAAGADKTTQVPTDVFSSGKNSSATRPSDISAAARKVNVDAEATASEAAAEGKSVNQIAAANSSSALSTDETAAASSANAAPDNADGAAGDSAAGDSATGDGVVDAGPVDEQTSAEGTETA